MQTFPAPAKAPKRIIPVPENQGIRTTMEDGIVKSRRRFTRARFASISVQYPSITNAEMEAIMDFYQDDVGSFEIFQFTYHDPNSKWHNQVFNVRFKEQPSFTPLGSKYWAASIVFEEV